MAFGLIAGLLAAGVYAALTVKVPVPDNADKPDARLVLHLAELKLPPYAGAIVRVFADMPQANAETNVEDEHFLGYFTVLARNSGEVARGVERRSVTLDITDKKQLLAGRKEVTLTLVSIGGRSPVGETQKLTISRAYLAIN